MTEPKKNAAISAIRRLSAGIAQNCLTSLCDESARIGYDLQKIHCLAMAANFYFRKTFEPDFNRLESEIITDMRDCDVDQAIMKDVTELSVLCEGGGLCG